MGDATDESRHSLLAALLPTLPNAAMCSCQGVRRPCSGLEGPLADIVPTPRVDRLDAETLWVNQIPLLQELQGKSAEIAGEGVDGTSRNFASQLVAPEA